MKSKAMASLGIQGNHNLFIQHSQGGKLIVLVYVEDIMVTGDYLTERESLIGHIKGTDKIERVLVGKLVRERESYTC